MKNFGKMVKMMAVAVIMSAFFCSCNVAGGASYYDPSEASSNAQIGAESINTGTTGSGIGIVIKKISISVETENDRTEVSVGKALQMRCTADEGSDAIGLCEWYINGLKVAEGADFAFSQDRPGLYNVSCIAVDDANNPKLADCVQLAIVVK